MKRRERLCFLILSALLFFILILTQVPVSHPQSPKREKRRERFDLVVRYAPVIYQCAKSDQDYITKADFDGDWISNNNWGNQPDYPLKAYLYYSLVESKTHFFIFYSLFHPRDYEPVCSWISCHENDLESIQVVIEKDKTKFGKLIILETLAHGNIFLYSNGKEIKGGYLKVKGDITLEESHPVIFVEVYGHGIYGKSTDSYRANPSLWKTVVYRYRGKAEVPESINDKDASYELTSIYDSLWMHRKEVGEGRAFDKIFNYKGERLPAYFDGNDYGIDRANTPWGYNQATGDGVVQGDWFFDPAKAIIFHAGKIPNFSQEYIYSPYGI